MHMITISLYILSEIPLIVYVSALYTRTAYAKTEFLTFIMTCALPYNRENVAVLSFIIDLGHAKDRPVCCIEN